MDLIIETVAHPRKIAVDGAVTNRQRVFECAGLGIIVPAEALEGMPIRTEGKRELEVLVLPMDGEAQPIRHITSAASQGWRIPHVEEFVEFAIQHSAGLPHEVVVLSLSGVNGLRLEWLEELRSWVITEVRVAYREPIKEPAGWFHLVINERPSWDREEDGEIQMARPLRDSD